LKQSAQQVDEWPDWKLEVNRRVAEHKGRKGQTAAAEDSPAESHPADSPAARTAAKVAARFAKVPSYSELMAEEARAALRAAEAASRAALEAQAAAEAVLAGLEAAAASSEQQERESAIYVDAALERKWAAASELVNATGTEQNDAAALDQPSPVQSQPQSFEIRWDADMPVRDSKLRGVRASRGVNIFEVHGENLWRENRQVADGPDSQGFEVVEAAQDIPANLIEFPRELVATRKIRPRRAEGPYAASVAAQGQLSIFEVEQSAISTVPEGSSVKAEAGKHTWAGPEWMSIELDAEPLHEIGTLAEPPSRAWRAEPALPTVDLRVAPMNLRLMAAMVDFSLILAGFLTAVVVSAKNVGVLPAVREMELGSVLALAVAGLLYQALFLTFSRVTPGMKYAGLELCTFAGKKPDSGQRWTRAAASILSLLPMGLGVVAALLTEHNLCWHDRISKTYLRLR
jgi:uncharacterized RDD family membrane protein YckC